jgi:hypothetical protein
MQDEDILVVNAIEDEVLADWEATHAWAEVLVAATAEMRTGSEHIKAFSERVDEPVGNLEAAAFSRDVVPDGIEFSFSLGSKAVSHQLWAS